MGTQAGANTSTQHIPPKQPRPSSDDTPAAADREQSRMSLHETAGDCQGTLPHALLAFHSDPALRPKPGTAATRQRAVLHEHSDRRHLPCPDTEASPRLPRAGDEAALCLGTRPRPSAQRNSSRASPGRLTSRRGLRLHLAAPDDTWRTSSVPLGSATHALQSPTIASSDVEAVRPVHRPGRQRHRFSFPVAIAVIRTTYCLFPCAA